MFHRFLPVFRRAAVVTLSLAGFFTASCSHPRIAKLGAVEPEVNVREGKGDYVVLLHGFSVFNESLNVMARRVNEAGYETIDVVYPSRHASPESVIADYLRPSVKKYCTEPGRKIHFVGYSMGTVFTHRFLEESPPKNLGRVVFLAGPHKGIRLIELAQKNLTAVARFFGVAANRMGTEETDFPQKLGSPDFSPGVIMGKRSAFPFLSPFIPGPDDGIVPVEGGEFPGAADFMVIESGHTYMQKSKTAAELVIQFLKNGRFDHTKDYPPDHPRPRITELKRRHF